MIDDSPQYCAGLSDLRRERETVKDKHKTERRTRRRLTALERNHHIFDKTGGRCHICGGEIENSWDADSRVITAYRPAKQNYQTLRLKLV